MITTQLKKCTAVIVRISFPLLTTDAFCQSFTGGSRAGIPRCCFQLPRDDGCLWVSVFALDLQRKRWSYKLCLF
jgi:hypothetical protein